MTLGEQTKWWGVGLVAFIAIMFLLADVMLPFVLGAGIAYLADPLADRLQKRGLSRTLATVIITAVALLLAIALVVVLTPLLIDQIRLAVDAAPGIIGAARAFLETTVLPIVIPEAASDNVLLEALGKFQTQVQNVSVKLLTSAWSVGLAGVEFVTLIVVTPVVAFYLLLDWDHMIARFSFCS